MAFGGALLVEFLEPGREGEPGGIEELAVVGLFRPNGLIQESRKGRAEVGDDGFIESGEGLVVLGEVVLFVEMEPLEKEALHFLPGPWVFEEAVDVILEVVVVF